ncbi:MAG TPA: metal ABC transporter ATP-binding protein, partial [Steroidobacteraceae bacterium]|nr:metal ABC transporter ATP-binding protein [Steroidobacteraceae bacterium]
IDFAGVNLALGNTRILEDVSFAVRAGSIHCIVGANGGGKTSLIRSLIWQMPHSGRIDIHWQDGRVTGYVPQSLDFDKSLPITVMDFMAMTSQRRPIFLGVPRPRRRLIEAALDRVGLNGKQRARLGSLSGGERQRVLFAQAMIPEPALLILDEPMTGLDLAGKGILEGAIRDYARAGGTVVWINHDIVQVNDIADAMTYIDRRVLLDGAPRDVLVGGAAAHLFPTLALPAQRADA